MIMNTNSAKIAKVLGNFDFTRVQSIMEDLEWSWVDVEIQYSEDDIKKLNYEYIPEVSNLVEMAFSLLTKAISSGYAASGGFEATFNDGELMLKFVVEEAQVQSEDYVYEPVLPVCVGKIDVHH